MNPTFEVKVQEVDVRSTRFVCALVITNPADEPFEIIDVVPQLPKGVRLYKAVDATSADLSRRRRDVARLVSERLTRSAAHAHGDANRPWLRRAVEDPELAIGTAAEATSVRNALGLGIGSGHSDPMLDGLIQLLSEIETARRNAATSGVATLRKGEQHEAIHVLRASRSLLNVNSYAVAFEITFRDGQGHDAQRIAYASLTVAPGAFPLTVVAVATALLGVGLSVLTKAGALTIGAATTAISANVLAFPIAAVTALIVFNIIDFTSLRSQLKGQISWRSATFVGFVCGFLNERVLKAMTALLG